MRRFVMATVLACVLSGVALAGEIPIGGIAPPPPPASPTQASITATVVLALVSLLAR